MKSKTTIFAISLLAACAACAQTPAKLSFEVASIKATPPPTDGGMNNCTDTSSTFPARRRTVSAYSFRMGLRRRSLGGANPPPPPARPE